MHKIEFAKSAGKEVDGLHRRMQTRVMAAIALLAENPRPEGVKKLWDNTYRIRVGDYRVVYDVYDDRLVVLIVRVRHRKDVYRGLRP